MPTFTPEQEEATRQIAREEYVKNSMRERHHENDAAAAAIEDPFADDEPVYGYFPRQIIDLKLLLDHYCKLALKPKARGLPRHELGFKLLIEMALAPKRRAESDQRQFGLKSFVNRTPDQIFKAVGSERRRGNPALKQLVVDRYIKQDRKQGPLSKRRHRAVYNPPWGAEVWAIEDRFERSKAFGRAMAEEKKNLSPRYAANVRMLLPYLHTIGRPILVLLVLNHLINGCGRSDHAAWFLARLVGVGVRQLYVIMGRLEGAGLIERQSDVLRPGTDRNAPTYYTLKLNRTRLSAFSSQLNPAHDQNAGVKNADILLATSSEFGAVLDGPIAAVTAPPQAAECPAGKLALRPDEPAGSVGAQAASCEHAAKGLGAQKGDLPPASTRPASHGQPRSPSKHSFAKPEDGSAAADASDGTRNPAMTSRTGPDPATKSADDRERAGIRQHGDCDLTATPAAEGMPEWLDEVPLPSGAEDYGWYNAEAA